ncbi:unnamed protein product, partial [Polarella glacialis]
MCPAATPRLPPLSSGQRPLCGLRSQDLRNIPVLGSAVWRVEVKASGNPGAASTEETLELLRLLALILLFIFAAPLHTQSTLFSPDLCSPCNTTRVCTMGYQYPVVRCFWFGLAEGSVRKEEEEPRLLFDSFRRLFFELTESRRLCKKGRRRAKAIL